MKKVISLVLVFIGIISARSQSFEWARSYGGNGWDNGNGIACDASGFVYTTGFYTSNVSFSTTGAPITLTTSNEGAYIVKLDSMGNALWVKEFTGTLSERGVAITIDPSGNVLVTGLFTGVISCPTHTLTSAGGIDVFMAKLDNNGNFLWAKSIGGTLQDEGNAIKTDASGNVYVGGRFEGTVDFDPGVGTYTLASNGGSYDGYLLKLDPLGNFLWAANVVSAANDDNVNGIAIDVSGNPYYTGSYNPSGSTKMIVEQRNPLTGAYIWGSLLGTTTSTSNGTSIVFDSGGNLVLGGYFRGTADFNLYSGSYTMTAAGSSDDVFIIKINPAAASFLWAVRFGSTMGDRLFGLAVDQGDNIWSTGYFNSNVDFNPGTGSFNLSATTSTAPNVFISRLSSNSGFLWAGQFGGTADDAGYSIATDAYKNVYSTGYFKNTADFDPSASSYSLTTNAGGNIYVHKLTMCNTAPSLTSAISGSNAVCLNSTNVYSISVGNDVDSYNWTLPSGWTGSSTNLTISATASNSTGVITFSATNLCGTSTQSLNVTVFPLPTVTATTSQSIICTGNTATLSASGATSFTWNTGATGSSISVSPITSTQYTVTGTNSNGCQNSTIITQSVSACTGLNEHAQVFEVMIKPNPFTDKITIQANKFEGESVLIINSLGQVVYSAKFQSNIHEIDLRELADGFYIVTVGEFKTRILKE